MRVSFIRMNFSFGKDPSDHWKTLFNSLNIWRDREWVKVRSESGRHPKIKKICTSLLSFPLFLHVHQKTCDSSVRSFNPKSLCTFSFCWTIQIQQKTKHFCIKNIFRNKKKNSNLVLVLSNVKSSFNFIFTRSFSLGRSVSFQLQRRYKIWFLRVSVVFFNDIFLFADLQWSDSEDSPESVAQRAWW